MCQQLAPISRAVAVALDKPDGRGRRQVVSVDGNPAVTAARACVPALHRIRFYLLEPPVRHLDDKLQERGHDANEQQDVQDDADDDGGLGNLVSPMAGGGLHQASQTRHHQAVRGRHLQAVVSRQRERVEVVIQRRGQLQHKDEQRVGNAWVPVRRDYHDRRQNEIADHMDQLMRRNSEQIQR